MKAGPTEYTLRTLGRVDAPADLARVPVALREWGQRAGYLIDLDGTQLHLIEDRPSRADTLDP